MSCPKCKSENGLKQVVELRTNDSDDRSKTHASWMQCQNCGSCFYGETIDYFDCDDFSFRLYEAENKAWNSSLKLALECPLPPNPLCQCAAHTESSRQGIIKLQISDSVYYNDWR